MDKNSIMKKLTQQQIQTMIHQNQHLIDGLEALDNQE